MKKSIKTITVKAQDIKTGFGNPRKITKEKRDELRSSIETLGDFGLFLVDENMNVIAGNQRLSVIMEMNPEQELLCKQLIGYTNAELRAINIKDNTHAGDLDLELLADWTADLQIDLGIKDDLEMPKDIEDREIPEMELIHYEKYDYVLIACRSELDYNDLVRKLGIEGKKVKIAKKRKINARAIWYDKMQAEIVSKEEYDRLRKNYKGEKNE